MSETCIIVFENGKRVEINDLSKLQMSNLNQITNDRCEYDLSIDIPNSLIDLNYEMSKDIKIQSIFQTDSDDKIEIEIFDPPYKTLPSMTPTIKDHSRVELSIYQDNTATPIHRGKDKSVILNLVPNTGSPFQTINVSNNPYGYDPDLETKPKSAENQCTCDFNDLMRYGCKCGSFKREQEGKVGIDLDKVMTDILPDTSRIYNVGMVPNNQSNYSTLYQINVGFDMLNKDFYYEDPGEILNRKRGEKIKIRTSYPTIKKYLCEVIKINVDKEIVYFNTIKEIPLDT